MEAYDSDLAGNGAPDYTKLPRLSIQQGDAGRARFHLKVTRVMVRLVFLLFFRVRVSGLRNVPHSAVIICANHLGWADPFLVLLFFPLEPRIYVLADHNAVSRTGFRAAMMNLLKLAVPMDPGNGLRALRTMEGVLRRGGSLLIFPEGAPPPNPQESAIRKLYDGASLLSVTTGVPIVPVGISGTSELWLQRTLRMRVGSPFKPDEFDGERRARTHAMTARLEETLRVLVPATGQRTRVKILRRWLTGLFA